MAEFFDFFAEGILERVYAFAGDGGDGKQLQSFLTAEGGEAVEFVLRLGDFFCRGGAATSASADAGDQRALAHVGIADQADIRQQLEFEAKEAFFAAAAEFVLARRLMGGGGEAGIAASAAPAAGDDDALIGAGKIVQAFAGSVVIKDGADGDFEHDIVAFASALIAAFAVASALGLVLRVEAEMDQRVVALAGFHVDVAAAAAVAAGRAAARNELFAAKRDASVA